MVIMFTIGGLQKGHRQYLLIKMKDLKFDFQDYTDS